MAGRRISIHEIKVGVPLQWDVLDVDGILLLRKGYIINELRQVRELVERGLFANMSGAKADNMRMHPVAPSVSKTAKPSVLRMIN